MGSALPRCSDAAWMRFVRVRFPGSFPLPTVTELVYDYDAADVIRAHWPEAKFTDATDMVHESRFEVEIPNCDADEFYAVMILEGWVECCLGFEIKRRIADHHGDVRRYLDLAKSMKEAGYVPVP